MLERITKAYRAITELPQNEYGEARRKRIRDEGDGYTGNSRFRHGRRAARLDRYLARKGRRAAGPRDHRAHGVRGTHRETGRECESMRHCRAIRTCRGTGAARPGY